MKLKAVSLFSGCGGLDLGMEEAGFDVVLANDIWEIAQSTYQAQFPKSKFHLGSITDFQDGSLLKDYLGKSISSIDLVFGGAPCPPFSKSRFYRKDMPRALDDPSGNETLTGFVNVIRLLRPKAFLFENVAGFAFKVHKEALEYLQSETENLGYQTSSTVLNAADFGVPQMRKRFFMVGTRSAEFNFPDATHASQANGRLPWKTAGDVLMDLDTEENACDKGHFAGGKHHDLLREVPPGDNYLYFTEKRGHPKPRFKWRSRYWSFLLKLGPDLPSWTIQARRSNNMGPFHWRNRILRIEEIKRLQTFPDDFELDGTIEQQWRQIGNAVPPLLGEVLGRAIADSLHNK